MRRSLVVAVVGGVILASLLGAVWVLGGERVGSVQAGEEMTQESTGAAISTDDIGNINYATRSDEREKGSNVGFDEARSPSDTAVETVEVLENAAEDIDQQAIDSCTVITESGGYELVDDIEGEAADFPDESGDACLRITASDVLLEGNNNAVVGTGEEETIGVLVASNEGIATENVTIRNLRAESWDTGIQVGLEYDNPSEARLEDVTATENGENGIYIEGSDGVDIETVAAHRNGGSGIRKGEEGDLNSLVDVTANENDVAGIVLDHTSDLVAEEITVSENGGHGLLLGWRVYTSEFTDVTATNNDGDGLHLDTDVNSNEFSEVVSSGNARHGIFLGVAGGNVFHDSVIEGNGDVGVRHVEDGSDYVNVTIRDNEDWQVETNGWAPFTASELEIGDTAEFVIDAEPVSLDQIDRSDLPELREDAQAVGDGVEVEGIEDSVAVSLAYEDNGDGNDEQIELWRYDGDEWISEETVDEADGSIEATLTEDGIYVPVIVDEIDESQVIGSCTVISESGVYELDGDVEGEGADFGDGADPCLRITTSDVVLDGTDNAVVGTGEGVGILVAGVENMVAENVTIRNLRAEGWDTGIRAGRWSETRLEDVIASENEGTGVSVSGGAEFETVEANRNGRSGIRVGEGDVSSMVNVTANENENDGLNLGETGDVVIAERITANGNGRDGIRISQPKDVVIAERIIVSENSRNGISLWSDVYNSEFSEVYASDNAMAGIGMYADSSGNVVRDSTIENNGGPGISYVENERNEFLNVTVRANEDWQVDTYTGYTYIWFSAAELRVGDTARFALEDESVALDDVDRGELSELPEDARPAGDGVEIEGIEDGVDVILEYDKDENDGQIELWRYDGDNWTAEETIDEADGRIDATLTEDGVYAPILVDEENPEIDLNIIIDDQDVTIVNQHDTAVEVTATGRETGEERLTEIGADETVTEEFEPGDYMLSGEAEDERPVTLNGEAELTITVIAADPPEFTVSNINPQNATISMGDGIDISATIENVGEATGTQTVEFLIGNDPVDATTVELAPGKVEVVTFSYDTTGGDIGELRLTVASDNETGSITTTLLGEAAVTVDIDKANTTDTIVAGETATVGTTIKNVGTAGTEETVTLLVDGEETDSTTVDLGAGGTDHHTFEIDTDVDSSDDLTVTLEGSEDTANTTMKVSEPGNPYFDVTIVDTPETAATAEAVVVTAEIENTGDIPASQPIEFTVTGHTATETVDLEVNESRELSFTWTPGDDNVGTHTITVASENESATTDLVVEDAADDVAEGDSDDDADTERDTDTDEDEIDAEDGSDDDTDEERPDDVAEEQLDDDAEEQPDDDAEEQPDDDVDEETDADTDEQLGSGTDEEPDNHVADEQTGEERGDDTDEDGPGFGIGGALVGLGSTLYLLRCRLADTGIAST